MSEMKTMQELEAAIERMVLAMPAFDVPSPEDLPDELADEFSECLTTLALGLVGHSADVQGDVIEILGEKMEQHLKALYPEKTEQQVFEVVKGMAEAVATLVAQHEISGE